MTPRTLPTLAVLSLLSASAAAQPLLLRQAVTGELTGQCTGDYGYESCRLALKFYGQGDADKALKVLVARAPAGAAEHYRIAKDWPKGEFWNLVATAGSTGTNCLSALDHNFTLHFSWKPKALSLAYSDSKKDPYLALSDLLEMEPGGLVEIHQPPNLLSRADAANVYRYCFGLNPDDLFAKLAKVLDPQ